MRGNRIVYLSVLALFFCINSKRTGIFAKSDRTEQLKALNLATIAADLPPFFPLKTVYWVWLSHEFLGTKLPSLRQNLSVHPCLAQYLSIRMKKGYTL